MRHTVQWIKSLVYLLQVYGAMAVVGICWFPFALFSKRAARHACHSWCAYAMWSARWLVGIRCEYRGTPPEGEAMLAGKHQSFLDVIMNYNAVPFGWFIMKHSLIYMPVLGQYALRIGCVPVKRGQRARAVTDMKARVARGEREGGQLIIYPQGSRIKPGAVAPYKTGVGALYEQLECPCVPVACNVGLFWPRKGIMRYPGTAVIEFLDPIPAGLPARELVARLEAVIEPASDRLLAQGRAELDRG